MATYVNNLRLKEIATGDESGTWGTSTNTNLELIGEALGIGTEAITTNANTHTTTVADGSSDAGRAIYLKYTGALDSDCTITIGPNTMKRVHIIENATTDSGSSGPYNIIISQGSGSNVTIANGKVAVVQLDGAGSGAAVLDAFTDLQVTDSLSVNGTTLTIGDATAEDTKLVFDGNAQDYYIGLDDSADDLVIGLGSAVGTTPAIEIDENQDIKFAQSIGVGQAASSTTGDIVAQTMSLKGTNPTLTIGDAGEEDTKIVFDGNAQDYYVGLDDSADDLKIGLGSAVGTTPAITVGSDQSVDFSKGIFVLGSGTAAGVYLNGTNSDTATQGNYVRFGTNFATQSNAANDTLITKTFNGSTFVDGFSVTSSGNVGILSTPVTAPLTISDKATISFNVNDVAFGNNLYYDSQVSDRWERLSGNAGGAYYQTAGAHIWYRTAAGGATGDAVTPTESMRITSSGEVGIGITPTSGRELHIYSANQDALKVEVATAINQIELKNNSGSPTYITQDSFGLQIKADENGFGGTASFFSVKVKATERLRIISGGELLVRATTATTDGGQLQLTSSGDLYSMYVSNTGFASVGSIKAVERGATSAYSFAQWYSGRRPDTGGGDREFNFRGDGNAYADGSFNNSGADYAEYFESHTGSAIPRGTSVVLENNKVRAATSEDDVADIIGVVRPKEFGKNSMVVGNTAWNMWSEKYLTDDFNCYVMEDYSVVSWYEYRDEDDDEGTLVTYESDNIPSDVTVPDDAETNTHDENGVKFQRRALNPDFNASLTYEPREDRDEWVIVGLIGQVQILDGQPTNDRWIKMRDISDTVEEWYIR